MVRALTRGDFISRAMMLHKNKYDYRSTYYVNMRTKICILCPLHGEFFQFPRNHLLLKQGCPTCNSRLKSREQFIQDAIKIHGNIYDYSKVDYKNSGTRVCIICTKHDPFYQLPTNHLSGAGCSKCAREKSHEIQKKSMEQFIEDAIRVHGNEYDYSKVEYINAHTKVLIVCLKHGGFLQTPSHHVSDKNKCPKCSQNSGYSKISIQFLNDLAKERKVEIQHAENKGEYIIKDPDFKCLYKCDGYYEQNNKKYIVEFHGNYYHGNPRIYKSDSVCKLRRITFGELYDKTMERMYRIKALGYEVIYIWEQDYKQYLHDRDNEFFFEGLFEYYKFL